MNEDIRANSENVICIRTFNSTPGDEKDGTQKLSFDYGLERSLRSNFGIAWERSGLDVDGGLVSATSVPVGDLGDKGAGAESPLGRITLRELDEMRAYDKPGSAGNVARGMDLGGRDGGSAEAVAEAQTLGRMLEQQWQRRSSGSTGVREQESGAHHSREWTDSSSGTS